MGGGGEGGNGGRNVLETVYLVIICTCIYMLMRDAEGRKKESSKVIQTTRQSNISS